MAKKNKPKLGSESELQVELYTALLDGYDLKKINQLTDIFETNSSYEKLLEKDPFVDAKNYLLAVIQKRDCTVKLKATRDRFDHSIAAVRIDSPRGCVIGWGRCFCAGTHLDGDILAKDLAIMDAVENFQHLQAGEVRGIAPKYADDFMTQLDGTVTSEFLVTLQSLTPAWMLTGV
ncbi:MAG TPA: hypothetical protein V6C81_08285 [Planktothrix sp.]|jgi:hypothetical protein